RWGATSPPSCRSWRSSKSLALAAFQALSDPSRRLCVLPKVPSKPKPKLEELIRTKPFSFQVQAFLRARRHRRFALFMEQGTGKTLVAIGLALYHYKRNRVKRVLVITPDS